MLMEEFGPVTAEQIRQLRSEGTLADDDLVRREDQNDWQPLSTLPDNGSAGSLQGESAGEAGPADIDDLSELSFTFEENRPASPKPIAREAAVVRETPPSRSEPVTRNAVIETPLYYYQSLGQTLGPMSLPELIQLAESGSIDGTDQIRKGDTGAWRSATDYPEMAAAIFSAERAEDTGPSLTAATQKRLGAAAFANLQTEQAEPEEMFLEDVPKAAPVRPAPKPAPVAEAPREERTASKPSRNSDPGSGKKRRKRTDDAVLEEIFDEVFTEEDSTPSRGAAVAASAAAAAAPPVMAAPTPSFPSAPAAPPAMAMPPAMTPGFGAAARPSSPSPALRNMKSSSGGSSFSGELDGKTIGIAGGLLVVVGLVTAYFMGWVELPVSIASVSQQEVDSALSEVKANFDKIDIKSVSDADWAAFQTATRTKLAGLVTQLDKSSDPSPEMMKAHRNARKFMTMSYLKVTDKDRIKKLKEEIEGK